MEFSKHSFYVFCKIADAKLHIKTYVGEFCEDHNANKMQVLFTFHFSNRFYDMNIKYAIIVEENDMLQDHRVINKVNGCDKRA